MSRGTTDRKNRFALAVAGGLVVVMGIDPGTLGLAWTGAAHASTNDLIDETRAENLDAALAALGMDSPAPSSPNVGAQAAPVSTPGQLVLPQSLPVAATEEVDLASVPSSESVAVDLGGMSVSIAAGDGPAPEEVLLTLHDQASTAQAGVSGVILEVSDASDVPAEGEQSVDVSVSYENFAGIGGGDWASRIQTIWVPECAPTDAATPECRPTPLASTHDAAAQTVTMSVPVPAAAMSTGAVAVGSGTDGPQGDWAATPLSPSSTWGTSGATGAFTWSYPMDVPQVPAGPSPQVGLSYSSAVSDGRIASSNNQSGVVGEGFDLGASFIERRYKSCADDETGAANNIDLSAPDLCWGPENATLSLNGVATELVRVQGTDTWRPKQDDGTRIQLLASGGAEGEYWKVTTTDGTQYSFGSTAATNSAWTVPVYSNHPGEPCHAAAFKDSSCTKVWRWNLDHVVDTSQNSASYFYTKETNHYRPYYGEAAASYVAGGYLNRIEYGTHPNDDINRAPAKVEFGHAPRCITSLAVANSWCSSAQTSTSVNHWPDTPVDLICDTAAGCETYAPTFFNRTRLASISTHAASGSAYQMVDSWTLAQEFVPQGQGIGLEYASGIHLVLNSITRTAKATNEDQTDLTLPTTAFTYKPLKNRVEEANTGADALWRHRLLTVSTDTGSHITVNYVDPPTCTPAPNTNAESNASLCFPVKWHHPAEPNPRTDYFFKYVVASVNVKVAADGTHTDSLPVITSYDYTNANWKWVKPKDPLIDDADETYSEFRGAKEITTLVGDAHAQQTRTTTSYYRGTGENLHPDLAHLSALDLQSPVTDHERLIGKELASTTYNGAHKVSATINTYGEPGVTATSSVDASLKAERITSHDVRSVTYDAVGAREHQTRTVTTFNESSQPTVVSDLGDVTTGADDLCTTTNYAHVGNQNLVTKHLVALPSAIETVSKTCGSSVSRPADVVSASKISYNAAGRPTVTETIDPDDGDGYIQQASVEYTPRGVAWKTTDAAGNLTETEQTVEPGRGLVTGATIKNPLGHVTSTTIDPYRGVPTESTDANGRTTAAKYDSLGRLLQVKYPQHASLDHPSIEYDYTVGVTPPNTAGLRTATGLNSVVTRTISADGARQHATAMLYDGLLRPFQSQQDDRGTVGGDRGRMIAHTVYDSTGRIVKQTEPWWVEDSTKTGTAELMPDDTSGHTTFHYDGAGRQTAEIFWIGTEGDPGNEKWRTVTDYDGATTLQIPPMGGIPTSTTVDARGRTIELTQHHRDADLHAGVSAPEDVRALQNSKTTYTYDPAGRLTGMTDPAPHHNEWTYEYDWAGRQIAASDPDAGDSSTTYDVLGRATTRTNGNGQTLGYTYDALGRTTSIRDGSPTGTVRASWEYDTVLDGILTSSTRTVNGHDYVTRTGAWDAAYRPLETTLELPNTGAFTDLHDRSLTTSYTYTVDGQQASVTHPAVIEADGTPEGKTILGAETVTTVYDEASSTPSWTSGGFGWGTYVASSRFAADGRLMSTDLGNTYGAVVTYGYEQGTKRLSSISLDREQISGTDIDLRYTYDPAGNVTSIKDTPTRQSLAPANFQDNQCFSYDKLNRLETAWTPADGDCEHAPSTALWGGAAKYWDDFSYDVLGNRTSQTMHYDGGSDTATLDYGAGPAGPHAVTSVSAAGMSLLFAYDDAGNRTSFKANVFYEGTYDLIDYTWDAEGELIGSTGMGFNGMPADDSYIYDADGNRIVRASNGFTTIYAGSQEITLTYSGAVKATRYYSFSGQTVAMRTGRGLGNAVTSLVNDHHGTPIGAISNGAHPRTSNVSRLYTDPFGGTRGGSWEDTVPGDKQFLGKTRDESTGLTQIGARYYDELVGSFISVDPLLDLTDPQQWNGYAYAHNNPVSFTDPTGLLPAGAGDWTKSGHFAVADRLDRVTHSEAPATVDIPVTPSDEAVPNGSGEDTSTPELSDQDSLQRWALAGPNIQGGVNGCAPNMRFMGNAYTNGSCVTPEVHASQNKPLVICDRLCGNAWEEFGNLAVSSLLIAPEVIASVRSRHAGAIDPQSAAEWALSLKGYTDAQLAIWNRPHVPNLRERRRPRPRPRRRSVHVSAVSGDGQ